MSGLARGLLDGFDTAVAALLRTLNNGKWILIILRAELSRRRHGPTFDDPEKLREYLAAN
jgi:hypothetical protein